MAATRIKMIPTIFIYLCLILSNTLALRNPENEINENKIESNTKTTVKDCNSGIFNPTCLKLEAISLLEKLNTKEEVKLLPGVSVVRDVKKSNENKTEENAAEFSRSLISKSDERLDKYLLFLLGNYLDSHSVQLRLVDDNGEEARTLVGEARGKGVFGKKGGLGGLMAAALMMKGTLMSIGIGGLALLAGKALITAMMSLLLSVVVGLKSLATGKGSTTYEIVSKPVYSHTHSSAHEEVGGYGHSAYGRSLNVRKREAINI